MSFVKCKECWMDASDNDKYCPHCGKPMPFYGAYNPYPAHQPPAYQKPVQQTNTYQSPAVQKPVQQTPAYQPSLYQVPAEDGAVRCPRCRSTQISANKKGFSGINAVGGVLLVGGIGALAGTVGSNKIKITCMSCNYQFDPGDKPLIPVGPVVFKWSTFFGGVAVVVPFLIITLSALHFWGFLAALVIGMIYFFILKIILKP